MTKILKNLFLTNWQVKLFCAIAASLLWFYVASSQQSIAKFPGEIKIKTVNVPSELIPIYDQKTVEIKVMAKQSDWQKLSAGSFSANVDLSGLTAGTHEVDVNVTSSVSGVIITEINPSKMIVSLDPLMAKEVKISKKIEGNAADGMVAGSVDFTPAKVKISGAKSLVESIEEVFGTVILNGQSTNFQEDITLSVYDADGKTIDGVLVFPNEVEATIKIVKGSNVKTLGIKPKIVGSVKAGYYVASVGVSPTVAEVTGPRNTINDTSYLETSPIDITGLSSNLEKEVALTTPSDLTVLNSGLTKVKVIVTIETIETTQEVSVNLFKPLNFSGEIDSYTPAIIKLTLKGPASSTNFLTQGLTLSYDFDKLIKIDDHNFILQVEASQFDLPSNVSVVSINPTSVSIKTK